MDADQTIRHAALALALQTTSEAERVYTPGQRVYPPFTARQHAVVLNEKLELWAHEFECYIRTGRFRTEFPGRRDR